MVESRRSLLGVLLYGWLAAALVWSLRPGGLVGLFAAPLLLFCPGYALSCALRGGGRMDPLEVAVRTVALGFASAALGGLVLNAIGVGLGPRSWATLMLAITMGAGCVAIRRCAGGARSRSRSRSIRRAAASVAASVAIVALLVVAAVVAHDSESALDKRQSTTELSVVVDASAPHALRILVGNNRAAAGQYRLLIRGAGVRIDIPVALRPGQSRALVVQRAQWSSRQPVIVRLLRAAEPSKTYRSVIIR